MGIRRDLYPMTAWFREQTGENLIVHGGPPAHTLAEDVGSLPGWASAYANQHAGASNTTVDVVRGRIDIAKSLLRAQTDPLSQF